MNANGKRVSAAQMRRAELAERAMLIAALGMEPEGDTYGEKYPATYGEMLNWTRERPDLWRWTNRGPQVVLSGEEVAAAWRHASAE